MHTKRLLHYSDTYIPKTAIIMPALKFDLVARHAESTLHELVSRQNHRLMRRNWPSENVGVMLVFCLVFVIFIGLIALFVQKRMVKRRAMRQNV